MLNSSSILLLQAMADFHVLKKWKIVNTWVRLCLEGHRDLDHALWTRGDVPRLSISKYILAKTEHIVFTTYLFGQKSLFDILLKK